MFPVPIIVAGGVAAAVSLIVNWALRDPHEPSTVNQKTGPRDSLKRRSTKPQCVKIGLMVWHRASMQEAHEVICALTGTAANTGLKGRASEPQVRAIAKLVWHRASTKEASELIRALDKLPQTPRQAMQKSLSDDDDPHDPLFGDRAP